MNNVLLVRNNDQRPSHIITQITHGIWTQTVGLFSKCFAPPNVCTPNQRHHTIRTKAHSPCESIKSYIMSVQRTVSVYDTKTWGKTKYLPAIPLHFIWDPLAIHNAMITTNTIRFDECSLKCFSSSFLFHRFVDRYGITLKLNMLRRGVYPRIKTRTLIS